MRVILVMAMTLDGKIARKQIEPVDWTGKADKKKFIEITRKAGAVIMGSTTFDTIGQILPGRKNVVMTRNPLRLHDNFADSKSLMITDKTPVEIIKSLEDDGFESAALIGGSIINSLFAKENLIDEIYLTIVPKLFGEGLPMLSGELDINLELAEIEKIDNHSVLLKYNVIKSSNHIQSSL